MRRNYKQKGRITNTTNLNSCESQSFEGKILQSNGRLGSNWWKYAPQTLTSCGLMSLLSLLFNDFMSLITSTASGFHQYLLMKGFLHGSFMYFHWLISNRRKQPEGNSLSLTALQVEAMKVNIRDAHDVELNWLWRYCWHIKPSELLACNTIYSNTNPSINWF